VKFDILFAMKISVITAVWNAAKTIRDAMESVARQKGVEVEYIVVDGGSTDGTVEVIKEFEGARVVGAPRIRSSSSGSLGEYTVSLRSDSAILGATTTPTPTNDTFTFKWVSERDKGLYDAINKGIRMATGDVVGICNADDVLASDDVLLKIASAFEQGIDNREQGIGAELDCVYGKIRFVNELGGKTVRRCFTKLWRPWMLQWGYMPPHPGVFVRKACFEKWGYYVPDRKEYKIAADYELLIRFFRVHQMRAKYSGLCTHIMRTGGVSTKDVNARKVLNEEIIKGNRVNGYFCCWPMLLPKYAIKVWEVILPRIGFTG